MFPSNEGFLAEADVSLKSKEGLDYYKFWMSNPGLRGAQDFLLQVGKIGVYHAQIEYDELQHLYCTVNPYIFANNNIGILVQRLRFSGYYTPTPEIAIFAEDQFLRRTGWQANSYETGPGNPLNFTTTLRPIKYTQNDMKVGVEYDRPTDEKARFRVVCLIIFRPLTMAMLSCKTLRGPPLYPCPQAIWPTTLPLRGHWT